MFEMHLWTWWSAIPIVLLLILAYIAVKKRQHWLAMVGGISLAIMVANLVMLPISYIKACMAGIGWERLQANGIFYRQGFVIESDWGLACIKFGGDPDRRIMRGSVLNPTRFVLAARPSGGGPNLMFREHSITRWAPLEILGFQMCWWHGYTHYREVEGDPKDGRVTEFYSITVPHWFVILVSLAVAMWSFRKYRHTRWKRLRGGFGVANASGQGDKKSSPANVAG